MLNEIRADRMKIWAWIFIAGLFIAFTSCTPAGSPTENTADNPSKTESTASPAYTAGEQEMELTFIEIVLKLDLLELRGFNEGKAAAQNSEGLWGFVDMQGNWIIEPEYDGVGDFSEGRAKVGFASEDAINSQSEEAQLIADASGEENIPIENNRIILDKWGYINEKGDVIVEPQYKYANDFGNGLAYVGDNSGPYYIDYDGNVALNPDDFEGYQFDGDFEQDGTAVIYGITENGAERTHYSGVIDKEGNLLIDGYELNISNISKSIGGYRIAESNNKSAGGDTGVIDAQGEWVIEPIYDEIEFFDDDTLVATQVTEGILESGLMTLDGQWLAEPDGTKIQDFGYGMIVRYSMREPQKMDLYDYDGNILLRGKSWQTIAIAGNGLVLCKKDDPTPDALFWSDGTPVMAGCNAMGGRYLTENLISVTVNQDDKKIVGIIDKANPNEWLAEPKYDRILPLDENILIATVINREKTDEDTVSFCYETLDMSGVVLSVSGEITLAYDTYRSLFADIPSWETPEPAQSEVAGGLLEIYLVGETADGIDPWDNANLDELEPVGEPLLTSEWLVGYYSKCTKGAYPMPEEYFEQVPGEVTDGGRLYYDISDGVKELFEGNFREAGGEAGKQYGILFMSNGKKLMCAVYDTYSELGTPKNAQIGILEGSDCISLWGAFGEFDFSVIFEGILSEDMYFSAEELRDEYDRQVQSTSLSDLLKGADSISLYSGLRDEIVFTEDQTAEISSLMEKSQYNCRTYEMTDEERDARGSSAMTLNITYDKGRASINLYEDMSTIGVNLYREDRWVCFDETYFDASGLVIYLDKLSQDGMPKLFELTGITNVRVSENGKIMKTIDDKDVLSDIESYLSECRRRALDRTHGSDYEIIITAGGVEYTINPDDNIEGAFIFDGHQYEVTDGLLELLSVD